MIRHSRQYRRQITENTSLGGLPLLRRLLGQLSEKRLIKIDDVLTELTHLMKAAESE